MTLLFVRSKLLLLKFDESGVLFMPATHVANKLFVFIDQLDVQRTIDRTSSSCGSSSNVIVIGRSGIRLRQFLAICALPLVGPLFSDVSRQKRKERYVIDSVRETRADASFDVELGMPLALAARQQLAKLRLETNIDVAGAAVGVSSRRCSGGCLQVCSVASTAGTIALIALRLDVVGITIALA